MEPDSLGDLPLIDVPVAHEERVERLMAAFREQFGRAPQGIAEAPGRVNLIGEHVDYNDGLVLPFAIDRSVMSAWGDLPNEWFPSQTAQRLAEQMEIQIAKEEGRSVPDFDLSAFIKAYSVDFESELEVIASISGTHFMPLGGSTDMPEASRWAEYVEGVVWLLRREGAELDTTNLALQGDVPLAAGLSSSAALEVAVGGALRSALSIRLDDPALAKLCQRAENEYVGVQCGIMDQFASALSKRYHALLIDCRTLAYRHVPLRLAEAGLAIVIANSAVRRELVTSAYNERRRECEEAVARLRVVLGRPELSSLRDVSAREIEGIEISDGDAVLLRARHVVSEIGRVAEAVEALEGDEFRRLGELMVGSHRSLREDYDVSSEQLDLLVGLATAREHVLGARLTGAGFGGCTVNLVRADRVEDFARDVIAVYRERTGLPAVMYVTAASDGLRTWRV